MSLSFILFDHLFICTTDANTSVYITTQKSAIDLFTHCLSLCFPLWFYSSLHLYLSPLSFHLSVAIILRRHTEVKLMLLIQK